MKNLGHIPVLVESQKIAYLDSKLIRRCKDELEDKYVRFTEFSD